MRRVIWLIAAVVALAAAAATAGEAGAARARSACAGAPGGGLTLTNVAAHGGRLVAVGSDGLVATSSGGLRWHVHRTGVQHDLRGVAWAGSDWVAIGDGGTILRSLDRQGARWVQVPGIPSTSLRAIAAKPGLIAVGGSAGLVLTSSDGGRSWGSARSGTSATLWGGASGGGTLYLVGQNATVVASADGAHWRRVPTAPRPTGKAAAPRPFLWQMAISGRRRIAVGDFGAILESRRTGRMSGVRSPVREILRGAAFGRGRFVIVGSGGVVVAGTGPPGGWRPRRSGTAVDLRGVAWTGRRFVAVGDEGTVLASADGRSWQVVASAMPCALLGVARAGRRLVVVGGDGAVLASPNGRRWRRLPRFTSADLYSVAHGPRGFVAVGTGGAAFWSSDGRRWIADRRATSLNLHAVAWTGSAYLAGGDVGVLLSSRDGRRWHLVRFPGFHAVRAFATGTATVVAAGSGTVARRAAGGRWQLQAIGFQHFWTGAAYGAGTFVIVGHNGTALRSANSGATWTAVTTGVALNLDAITWTGKEFVASGRGVAVASTDGVTWTPVRLPTTRSVRALTPYRGGLLGVGDLGTIVRFG